MGPLRINPENVVRTQVTSSVIGSTILATSYLEGLGVPVHPEDAPVIGFNVVDEKKTIDGVEKFNLVTIGQELHWHQPFDFSLLSVWPLDFPEYLWYTPPEGAISINPAADPALGMTAGGEEMEFNFDFNIDASIAHDGPFVRGVQRVGLAPNRIAPRNMALDPYAFMQSNPGELNKWFQEPNANQPGGPGSGQEPSNQVTGAAGELIFSTKPTITLYNKQTYRRPLPFPSSALLPGGKSFFIDSEGPTATETARKYVFNGAEFSEPIVPLYDADGDFIASSSANMAPNLSTPMSLPLENETSRGSYEPKPLVAQIGNLQNFNEDKLGIATPNWSAGQGRLDYESIHHTTFLRNGNATLKNSAWVTAASGALNIYEYDKNIREYFYLDRSAELASGYSTATASMQYLRHAWPYYQPIWRLDKLTGRTPFHNSYSEFIKDVDLIGRDYSQISEFTISDNFEEYKDVIEASKSDDVPLYTITSKMRIKRNFFKQVDYVANFASIAGVSNSTNKLKKHEGAVLKPNPGQDNVLSSSATSASFPVTSTMHDLEYADYTVVNDCLKADEIASADGHWRMDKQSVSFMSKYMQTNACSNFAKFVRQNAKGISTDKNTVPRKIRLTVKAITKLLPKKDLYPVFRTTNLGSQLLDAYSEFLNYSKKEYFGINSGVSDSHKNAAATQSFLEPLFAPGIMFNSIKSGMAVSYPLFLDHAPYYYGNPHIHGPWGPSPFPSPGNKNSGFDNLSYRIDDPKTMFSYGLANSAGVNRTAPTYLMRSPSHQLPFEAIYNPEIITSIFSNNKSYMVDDLFDQSRSQYVTGAYNQAQSEYGDPGPSHEWTFATASIAYAITASATHTEMTGTRFIIHMKHAQSGEVNNLDGTETYGMPEYVLNSLENHRQSAIDPSFALWPEINNQTGSISDFGLQTFPDPGPVAQIWQFEGVANTTDPATLTGSQFLIGTSAFEYATNLAAAINQRTRVTSSVNTGSDGAYDIDGNYIPKTNYLLTSSVHQLFTASVLQDTSGKYGQPTGSTATILKIHTAGPLMTHGIQEAPFLYFDDDTLIKYDGDNWDPLITTSEPRIFSGGSPDGNEHSIFGSPITNKVNRGRKFTDHTQQPGKSYHSFGFMDRIGGSYPRNVAQHEFKPHVKLIAKAKNADPSFKDLLYRSSINNFLAETVNFFLEPSSEGRYYDLKLPVIVSNPH